MRHLFVRGSTLTETAHPGQALFSKHSHELAGDLAKEYGTNKPTPTARVQEKSKGDAMCPTISQNPSFWRPSWLSNECTTRNDPESE